MKTVPALLRVSNVDQSISFYREVFGMHLLQKRDYPAGRFTCASLGYDFKDGSQIELSQQWGGDDVAQYGAPYNQKLLLEVDDATRVYDHSKYVKGEVLMSLRTNEQSTEEAVVKDPDGYIIHAVERRH